jgi:hypothetical protein
MFHVAHANAKKAVAAAPDFGVSQRAAKKKVLRGLAGLE